MNKLLAASCKPVPTGDRLGNIDRKLRRLEWMMAGLLVLTGVELALVVLIDARLP